MDRYTALVEALQAEIPGFRIVRKDQSRFHRAIHVALKAVTFGRMTDYLESYQTTIGKTVYVTSDWDDWPPDRRYVTLRHEAIHLRQFRKLTLPVMALLYVLLPLPMGLAYFRARFEKEAYAETIRAESRSHTPLGILTRGVSGIRGRTLIVNFPGNPKAIGQSWPVVEPTLRHAAATLERD